MGAGGEARVYALRESFSLAAKLYHQPTEQKARKLAAMLANPPHDSMKSSGHTSIAWPVDLLLPAQPARRDADFAVGFLMPRIHRMKPVFEFYHPRTRRQNNPLFNYLYLHRAACNLATAVRSLHERGYVIGDVNESNILVAETALVTLVDTDSFQVRDRQTGEVYRCAVGKPEFTPPELQGKYFAEFDREPTHDLFGLAVLLFQLLMEGTHPFAGLFTGRGDPPPVETRISSGHFPHGLSGLSGFVRRVPYRPMPAAPPFEILSPQLQELFIRCFDEGHSNPQARPDAQTWIEALKASEDSLLTCSANAQHRYGAHLPDCPWCGRAKQLGGRDPFPSKKDVEQRRHLAPAPKKPKPQPVIKPAPVIVQLPVTYTPTTYTPLPSSGGGTVGWGWIGRMVWICLMLSGVFSNLIRSGCDSAPDPASRVSRRLSSVAPRADSSPVATLSGHTEAVQAVSFSPEGKLLAGSSSDKTIRIWSVGDQRIFKTLKGHTFNVLSLAFAPKPSPQGFDLASGGFDKWATLWKAGSSEMKILRPQDGSAITSLAFSNDGRLLATGSLNSGVRLWNLENNTLLHEFNNHRLGILAVAFSLDGKRLAAGSSNGLITFYDAQTGEIAETLVADSRVLESLEAGLSETPQLSAMAFSPDLSLVAVGGYDSRLQIWDTKSGSLKLRLGRQQGTTFSLAFWRNGSALASGHNNGKIILWNPVTGLGMQEIVGGDETVNAVAISPGGDLIAGGGSDRVVRLWKVIVKIPTATFSTLQDDPPPPRLR